MKTENKEMFVILCVLGVIAILFLWKVMGDGMPLPSNTEENGTTQVASSVSDVIAGIDNGARFRQLMAETGVANAITGKGPYTVFVATDGAFGRLVPGTINNMTAAQKKRTLQYHVVSGKKLDVDAVNSGQVQALSQDTLNFQVDTKTGKAYVNSGAVIATYKAKNGIVYVINAVLLPPK